MRAPLFKRYVAVEMLALSLIEMALTFTMAFAWLRPASGPGDPNALQFAIASTVTVGFIAFAIGSYRPKIFQRAQGLAASTAIGAILSFPAVWVVSKALGLGSLWPVGYDPFRPIKIMMIWGGGVVVVRLAFLTAARCNLFLHRVAIVGLDGSAMTSAVAKGSREGFLEINTVRPEMASAAALRAKRVRTLVFSGGTERLIVPAIRAEYLRNGVTIQELSEFWEQHLRRVDVTSLSPEWFANASITTTSSRIKICTRLFDVLMSCALVVATSPLMVIIVCLIRLDSQGPILYRQERIGLGGKPFTVLKFRSMKVNAEAAGPSWAQRRDPRVTRFGSIMRQTRMDELPQLFNILRGDMSFIGPRPERPHFVDQLARVIPHYDERNRVKPGLTGWAQVNYPYGASVEDARAKLSYDLYYVKHRTLFLDALIIFSTVRVILFQEGAR